VAFSLKQIVTWNPKNNNVTINYCKNYKGIWLNAGEFNKISKLSLLELKLEHSMNFFRLHFSHIFK
jgi:Zn-finger nucleic acid-binding protein